MSLKMLTSLQVGLNHLAGRIRPARVCLTPLLYGNQAARARGVVAYQAFDSFESLHRVFYPVGLDEVGVLLCRKKQTAVVSGLINVKYDTFL